MVQMIDKAPTGIDGFDEMTWGGLPRSRSTLVIGSPGAGKTVFALQGLVNGAREQQEPGIFVAFEEHADHIRANATDFGWDLPGLEEESLFFLDAHMPYLASGLLRMHTAYAGVRGTEAHFLQLKALIKEHEPTCVAIDPISTMLKEGGTVEAAGVAQRDVHQTEKRRWELQAARAEVKARMEALRHELEVKQAELEQLEADAGWRKRKRDEQEEEVRRRRRGQGQYAGYGEEE